jgi:hypothetical protein
LLVDENGRDDYDLDEFERDFEGDFAVPSLAEQLSLSRAFDFAQFLSNRLRPSAVARELGLARLANASPAAAADSASVAGEPIEARLAAHARLLHDSQEAPEGLVSQLIDQAGGQAELLVLDRHCQGIAAPDLLRNLCMFSPFWLRRPSTWQPPRTDRPAALGDLVQHLFGRYPIPECLRQAWGEVEEWPWNLNWLRWSILFGQGGSLRRAAKLFGWRIRDGFQHHFLQTPSHLDRERAVFRADVMSIGGGEHDVFRLQAVRSWLGDSFDDGQDHEHAAFRTETIRWLVHHQAALNDAVYSLVVQWATHEFLEARRRLEAVRRGELPDPGAHAGRVRLQGLSPRQAVARALEYQAAHLAYRWSTSRNLQWAGHDLDLELEDARGHWQFVELLRSEALVAESEALHHCVATYDQRCANGRSAIVSMRSGGKSVITIEVQPGNLNVVQVCGLQNRRPTREELNTIADWAAVMRGRKSAVANGGDPAN